MTSGTSLRIRNAAGWVLVACIVFLAWPTRLGGSLSLVVVSGHSMDGTYRTGDLLLTWPQAGYEKGDIVVYRVPDGEPASGLRVVHRIVTAEGGHFITQGDNRDSPDIWTLTAADIDGSPSIRIPRGGLALRWLFSPIALALVAAVCIYLVVLGKDEVDETVENDDPAECAGAEGDAGPVDAATVTSRERGTGPSHPAPAPVADPLPCAHVTR